MGYPAINLLYIKKRKGEERGGEAERGEERREEGR
jgi:hypothetical protein